jgi:hypothetical protein
MPTEFEMVLLATEVAVIVTGKSPGGNAAGAVSVVATPLGVGLGETVPQGAGEHDKDRVTPLSAGSPVTVAVICAVAPIDTVLVLWVTDTAIELAVPGTVMLGELDAEFLAAEVAIIVTAKSTAGAVSGAV